jgi:aspartoacylase
MTYIDAIRRVAIVGGTHGNEWTGIYLAKKFQHAPQLVQRPSFTAKVLLGNLAAIDQSKRYIETDLNRCFSADTLRQPAVTYEAQRAQEIAQQLEPDDVIIDLHTTTANMGATLILRDRNPIILSLAAAVIAQYPNLKVCCSGKSGGHLSSMSPLGMTLEMGAIPQSTLDATLFQTTEAIVTALLDSIESWNQGNISPGQPLTLYQYSSNLDYPRTEAGELQAMIHPQLHHRDYAPLRPGDPLFLTFTGETIPYTGQTTVYPIFINEAAYYEKGIAMGLTNKILI